MTRQTTDPHAGTGRRDESVQSSGLVFLIWVGFLTITVPPRNGSQWGAW